MNTIWQDQGFEETGYACDGEIYLWYIYDRTASRFGEFLGALLTDAKDSQPSTARKRAAAITGLPFKSIRVRTMPGQFKAGPEMWKGGNR